MADTALPLEASPALEAGPVPVADRRQIVWSSVIGTTVEWYDFLIYGTATALVFNKLFFPSFDPLVGTIAAFGSYAVGFLARPLGGVIFGHFGDKIGRKAMLSLTIIIMGLGTFLIGCLPTYAQIGLWAPILLVALRLVQGIGIGGEWGGAAVDPDTGMLYIPSRNQVSVIGLYAPDASIGATMAYTHGAPEAQRMEQLRQLRQLAELDAGILATDVAELYTPLAEEKGITLVCETAEGLVVTGDRHLLSQALANLADNAVKYTASGGTVTVTARRYNNTVELAVADTGPGIPEADHERVFERFQRLEASRNSPGSGLGLSLVAAVARLHGAELVLEDNAPGLRVRMRFGGVEAG